MQLWKTSISPYGTGPEDFKSPSFEQFEEVGSLSASAGRFQIARSNRFQLEFEFEFGYLEFEFAACCCEQRLPIAVMHFAFITTVKSTGNLDVCDLKEKTHVYRSGSC